MKSSPFSFIVETQNRQSVAGENAGIQIVWAAVGEGRHVGSRDNKAKIGLVTNIAVNTLQSIIATGCPTRAN